MKEIPLMVVVNKRKIILCNTKTEVTTLFPKSSKPVGIGKGAYPNVMAAENSDNFWEAADEKLISKTLTANKQLTQYNR